MIDVLGDVVSYKGGFIFEGALNKRSCASLTDVFEQDSTPTA